MDFLHLNWYVADCLGDVVYELIIFKYIDSAVGHFVKNEPINVLHPFSQIEQALVPFTWFSMISAVLMLLTVLTLNR